MDVTTVCAIVGNEQAQAARIVNVDVTLVAVIPRSEQQRRVSILLSRLVNGLAVRLPCEAFRQLVHAG